MSALAIVIIVGAALIALTAWRMQNPQRAGSEKDGAGEAALAPLMMDDHHRRHANGAQSRGDDGASDGGGSGGGDGGDGGGGDGGGGDGGGGDG